MACRARAFLIVEKSAFTIYQCSRCPNHVDCTQETAICPPFDIQPWHLHCFGSPGSLSGHSFVRPRHLFWHWSEPSWGHRRLQPVWPHAKSHNLQHVQALSSSRCTGGVNRGVVGGGGGRGTSDTLFCHSLHNVGLFFLIWTYLLDFWWMYSLFLWWL